MLKLHKQLERCAKVPGFVSVRAGMGLGDSLYLQSVARHFIENGQKVLACSEWPEVFRPLGDAVIVGHFTRSGVDKVAHYTMRKGTQGTSQFEDCCIQAGIKEKVDLRLDWKRADSSLVELAKSGGKLVVAVALPRNPMGRVDGFGAKLLPDCGVIQRLILELQGKAKIIQIGKGLPLYKFEGIDLDLANKTTVSELLDVASVADAFLGYCSYLIPLAESFKKPGLFVWSSKGLKDAKSFVRQIMPKKIIHRETSRYVIDDWDEARILGVFNEFLRS